MPETGTSGSMSGDGKRGVGHRPQVTAPILDSTESQRIVASPYVTQWGLERPMH
jgi:hypothetical protein